MGSPWAGATEFFPCFKHMDGLFFLGGLTGGGVFVVYFVSEVTTGK